VKPEGWPFPPLRLTVHRRIADPFPRPSYEICSPPGITVQGRGSTRDEDCENIIFDSYTQNVQVTQDEGHRTMES
jgi:hypothetical protein